MSWSNWIECKFDVNGKLDTSKLYEAPTRSGIYAIATQTGWSYNVHYIGRSGSNIRGRLQDHFSGNPPRIKKGKAQYRGNQLIGDIVRIKKDNPSRPPNALYFAFLQTNESKLIEAAYIDLPEISPERPLGNFVRGKLPDGLRDLVNDIAESGLEE